MDDRQAKRVQKAVPVRFPVKQVSPTSSKTLPTAFTYDTKEALRAEKP
jgi:hypothetical protein